MPTSAVFTLTDPYEHQRAFRASDIELIVTEAGDYRAELKRLDFHRLWMQRTWENLPCVARASLSKDRVHFSMLAHYSQRPVSQRAAEVYPGDISIAPEGDDYHVRASADIVAPKAMKFLRPPPHLMSKLLKLHQAACDLATTAPASSGSFEGAGAGIDSGAHRMSGG